MLSDEEMFYVCDLQVLFVRGCAAFIFFSTRLLATCAIVHLVLLEDGQIPEQLPPPTSTGQSPYPEQPYYPMTQPPYPVQAFTDVPGILLFY
jgi:hypothetical protein